MWTGGTHCGTHCDITASTVRCFLRFVLLLLYACVCFLLEEEVTRVNDDTIVRAWEDEQDWGHDVKPTKNQ